MNTINTHLTELEYQILRRIAAINADKIGARNYDILNATDDDRGTKAALASLRKRVLVSSVPMEKVIYADDAGLWVTELGKMALKRILEGKHAS